MQGSPPGGSPLIVNGTPSLISGVMNMSLVITEGNYGDIYADDSSCHVYYIIKIYSYPYTLQTDLSIYGQVIYSSEMVCKGTYFFNKYQLSLLCFTKIYI